MIIKRDKAKHSTKIPVPSESEIISSFHMLKDFVGPEKWKSAKVSGFEPKEGEESVRFVVTSDTHARHNYLKLPKGDVLLHCGDFTRLGSLEDIISFSNWIGQHNFKHVLVISGNHEYTFDLDREKEFAPDLVNYEEFNDSKGMDFMKIRAHLSNCKYLENSGTELYGYKIYGTPYQNMHSNSAFQRKEEDLPKYWNMIPSDTDILLTHAPALGICDKTIKEDLAGSKSLLDTLEKRVHPLLHFFGHVHEAYGAVVQTGTVHANASFCHVKYAPRNSPFVFDLKKLKPN